MMRVRLALAAFAIAMLLSPGAAWAKKVSVEWKAIPGAKSYEIRFERDGKEILQAKLSDNEWDGKLAYGVYAYQIRGVDKRGRPGLWSEPTPLVVMPKSPAPQEPRDGQKYESFRQAQNVELKWQPVEGAHAYRVDVIKDEAVQTHIVEGTSLALNLLGAGKYTWTVTAQFLPKERALASLSGKKKWESAPSSKYDFKIVQRELEAPESLLPQGRVDPPAGGKLLLEWEPVEGAEAYEVTLEGSINRKFTTTQRKVLIPQMDAKDGPKKVKWAVRALASVAAAPLAVIPGPQSYAEIELDPFAEFVDGSGYIALSGLLSPSHYRSEVPSSRGVDQAGNTYTYRLSGEYWLRPRFGLGAGFDGSTYDFRIPNRDNVQAFRREFELYAKYRVHVPLFLGEWFFSPKAGISARDYMIFTNPGPSLLFKSRVLTIGPSVGFDLRKQLSRKMSLGIKVAYFVPLASPDGTLPLSGNNFTNISVGVQALYWVGKNIGLGLGVLGETRSVDVARDSAFGVDRVETHPMNLFGSLIYSFGR